VHKSGKYSLFSSFGKKGSLFLLNLLREYFMRSAFNCTWSLSKVQGRLNAYIIYSMFSQKFKLKKTLWKRLYFRGFSHALYSQILYVIESSVYLLKLSTTLCNPMLCRKWRLTVVTRIIKNGHVSCQIMPHLIEFPLWN